MSSSTEYFINSWAGSLKIREVVRELAHESPVHELEALCNDCEVCYAVLCNVILFVHGVENVAWSNVQTNIREVFVKLTKLFCKVLYVVHVYNV